MTTFGKVKDPCDDCINGYCTMNCSGRVVLPDAPRCGDWRDADTASKEGSILAWGPHHPDIAFTFDAGIFHNGRRDDMPPHLSTKSFTKWTPLPKLPSAD